MNPLLAVLVAGLAGSALAVQAPTNAALGRRIGDLSAAVANNVIGTVALLIVAIPLGALRGLFDDPVRWHYLGGFAGSSVVVATIVTIVPLGASLQAVSIVAGQLAMALVIDHFGLLGLAARPVTPAHLAGLVLVIAGVVVVART